MHFQTFSSSSPLGCYVRHSECPAGLTAGGERVLVCLSVHLNTGWEKEIPPSCPARGLCKTPDSAVCSLSLITVSCEVVGPKKM